MNNVIAIKLMLEGRKMRRKCWLALGYIYFEKDGFYNQLGEKINLNNIISNQNDWEEYIEPKKKVTMYKWAYLIPLTKRWKEVSSFFETKEKFVEYMECVETDDLIKRLDYTATEFEVEE